MGTIQLLALSAVVVAALVLATVVTLRLERYRDSGRRRRRALRALAAETASEELLEAAGYVIFDRQVDGHITVLVDGQESTFGLRADLIVGDGDRNFVAEVKTGDRAPSLGHAATRRQLLEYSIAFDVDGVLLIDADAGEIFEVDFEL